MILNDSKFNSHWAIRTLNELGTFKRGKSKHRPRNDPALFYNGKYPFVQTGEIKNANLYIRNHSAEYSEFGLKQSELWPENTLCITIAANIAETALLGYPMCFPDSVVGYNAYPDESSELFMHYVFTYVKRAIQNSVCGSIQDNINIDYLTNLQFRIPEKPYQDRIVSILSSIDKKIELNNKINAELEAMAKTIYDYWFVQFDFPDENGKPYKSSGGKMVWNEDLRRNVPLFWAVKKLGETCKTALGGTPSTDDSAYWEDGSIPWLSSAEIASFPIINSNAFVTAEGVKNSAAILLPKGSVVISIVRYIRPSILGISACTNQSVVGILETSDLLNSYIYPYMQSEVPRLMSLRTGAQQPHINKDTIDQSWIIVPEQKVLEKYYQIVNPIYKKILSTAFENKNLTELRDWLLPMLMNGQVTVK